MAIINTLRKCLDSPYLFEDPTAPDRVGGLLSKAGDRIEAASNLLNSGQAESADIPFLCYEAMFCCLRALVYSKGYREAGLRCLLLACEGLFVRPGSLDVDHIHTFERLQALRLRPEEAVAAASAFSKRTLELLGQ